MPAYLLSRALIQLLLIVPWVFVLSLQILRLCNLRPAHLKIKPLAWGNKLRHTNPGEAYYSRLCHISILRGLALFGFVHGKVPAIALNFQENADQYLTHASNYLQLGPAWDKYLPVTVELSLAADIDNIYIHLNQNGT